MVQPAMSGNVISRVIAPGFAYACILCNRYKGTDIASIDRSGRPIRLFDPRRDPWDEHFKLDGPIIQPLTPIGEVTARMLRLNAAERVIERRLFQAVSAG